jgi:hypothetical protein
MCTRDKYISDINTFLSYPNYGARIAERFIDYFDQTNPLYIEKLDINEIKRLYNNINNTLCELVILDFNKHIECWKEKQIRKWFRGEVQLTHIMTTLQ